MEKFKKVVSVQQAINEGFKFVIAKRDHYNGNSKGEIYLAIDKYKEIALSHKNMYDRGIYELSATNINVIELVNKRLRILNLISKVELSMSTYSKLFTGTRYQYIKTKMVFGYSRNIYGYVPVNAGGGATNFNIDTFFTRHNKMLACLKQMLPDTDVVSSTYAIYQ